MAGQVWKTTAVCLQKKCNLPVYFAEATGFCVLSKSRADFLLSEKNQL